VLYYVPNILTLWRVAATPILIVLLKDETYHLALVVFILAGVSDALDGYLAKRFAYETRFGAILDPVADKVLLVSCFVMLTLLDLLPFWLMVLVAFRDVLIVGGYLILVTLNGSVTMHPSLVSKINTAMQILLVTFVLARQSGMSHLAGVVSSLVVVVAVTTVWSGAQYVWVWGIRKESGAST